MLLTISVCLVFAPVVNPAVAQDAPPSMAAAGFGMAKMVGRIESDGLWNVRAWNRPCLPAVCFSPDAMSLLVTSEGYRAGIFEPRAR